MTVGPLHIYAINDNELPTPKGERQRHGSILREGRLIVQRAQDGWHRGLGLQLSWHFGWTSGSWGLTFGGGDSGRDLMIVFSIPFVATFYLTFERLFPCQLFKHDFDRGDDREIRVYFHSGAVWWSFWVGSMASWSRRFSWCKPWRQGSFNPVDFALGYPKFSEEVMETCTVKIPMPEGSYPGEAKVLRRLRKRPRWFARESFYVDVSIPKGIPFQGKGENSYDCGDDGLFGMSTPGRSVEDAIGRVVGSVLGSRRRYGMPSQAAIDSALSPKAA